MKLLLAVGMFGLSVSTLASTVAWNTAFIVELEEDSSPYDCWVAMGAPYLRMGINYYDSMLILSALPEANLANANCFVMAQCGNVVDAHFMESQPNYFAFARYDEQGPGRTDYSLSFNLGDSYYLAFSEERSNSITYGWVLLGYSDAGKLSVLASAWDKDGDSIIGGAIPEPSSGLLVLLGLAGLALRREHTIRTMRAGGSATAIGVRERGVREAPRKVPSRRSS